MLNQINKPPPEDLIPIFTKDKEKQRLIKEKSMNDAQSNEARVPKSGMGLASMVRVTSPQTSSTTKKNPYFDQSF